MPLRHPGDNPIPRYVLQLGGLFDSQLLGKQAIQRRNGIVERLIDTFDARWPEAVLTASCIWSRSLGPKLQGSHLDISIMGPEAPYGFVEATEEWPDVEELAAAIEGRAGIQPPGTPACNVEFEDVCAMSEAQPPFVTLTAKGKGQPVIVNIAVNH